MFIFPLKLFGGVADLIVDQHKPQLWFDDSVGRQHFLHPLQLLPALLGGGETLTSHWKVLEKLHYTHCCTCKRWSRHGVQDLKLIF